MKRHCVLTADLDMDGSGSSMIFFEKISDINIINQSYTTTYISFSSWRAEIKRDVSYNMKFKNAWTTNIYEFFSQIEEEE